MFNAAPIGNPKWGQYAKKDSRYLKIIRDSF